MFFNHCEIIANNFISDGNVWMLNPTFSEKKQSNVKTSAPLSGDSYKSLQDMVEVTAAMAEEAVSCSPNRARKILRNMDSEYNIEQVRRLVFKYQKTKSKGGGGESHNLNVLA